MACKFVVDGAVFVGSTVPGAARMRIHDENNRFVAAFDPDVDTLEGEPLKGSWVGVAEGIDPVLLQRLEPDVINACRERLAWFRQQALRTITCPRCESTSIAEILYGLPDFTNEDLKAGLKSGRIVLGGCVLGGNDPARECNDCGYRWD